MTRHEDADPSRRVTRRVCWGICLAALALVALPSVAAAKCTPIPGRSALDQYCESVPGAGGDKPTPGSGQRGGGSSLPPGQRRRLSAAGPDGRALLRLLENSGVPTSANSYRSHGNGSGNEKGGGADSPEADSTNNPLRAVKNAASTGPSAGPVYLWILIAIALFAAALGWLRYRSGRRAGPQGLR
jgi:hypothetical protein